MWRLGERMQGGIIILWLERMISQKGEKKDLLVRRCNNLGVTGCVKIDNSMSFCTSSFDHVSLVCDKWKESYKIKMAFI